MAFNQPSTREASLSAIFFADTNPHNGTNVDVSTCVDYELEIINSLNQAGNVQVQWSVDGVTWNNLGAAVAAAATTNLIAAVPTPKPFVGLIRCVYTATVAPASGTLTLNVQKRYM